MFRVTCDGQKITGVANNVNVGSDVPVSHDSVAVSQHAQYQDPEAEAAKWNPAYPVCVRVSMFINVVGT